MTVPKKIPVTRPFIPPISDYTKYITAIWESGWLTNDGPFVKQFEIETAKYLGVDELIYVGNGTLALQLAIKALGIEGEIITTPFSYVATTSSIVWEGCTPVFVDIEEKYLNINADLIEKAITKNTSAILATHVYGNPCNHEQIQKLAEKYNLKIIYDAAHCFGVKVKNETIFNLGDISITSFHATKLLHTVEGGGLFTPDKDIAKRLRAMRNFGHEGTYSFSGLGINAKNSELHASMGLVNLTYIDSIIRKRKKLSMTYTDQLYGLPLRVIEADPDVDYNYSYFPVVFEDPEMTTAIEKILIKNNIETRRYFNPTLDTLPYVEKCSIPVADSISQRVLCLPLYYQLSKKMIKKICDIIRDVSK